MSSHVDNRSEYEKAKCRSTECYRTTPHPEDTVCHRDNLQIAAIGNVQALDEVPTKPDATLDYVYNADQNLATILGAVMPQSEVASSLTDRDKIHDPILLGRIASSYHEQFELFGRLEDIDMAIKYQTKAVSVGSDEDPKRPGRIGNLGYFHINRFRRLGQLGDLRTAIEHQAQAVALTPDGHPDKPGWLGNLGGSYCNKFERLGQLPDLDLAIACESEAVSLTPDGHPEKPGRLSNLGVSYQRRFEIFGELPDFQIAIDCMSQAISLISNEHPVRPALLNNLGNSHHSIFERLGKPADLDVAIEYQTQAVTLIPDGRPEKPRWLSNLGASYYSKFELLQQLPDLNTAILYGNEAAFLIPDGHPDKPGRLSNLGSSYQRRFKFLGELEDLRSAIDCQSQGLYLAPTEHPDRSTLLSNLGNSHHSLFERLGQLADLDIAVECQIQAVALTPEGHPGRPGRLDNLGTSYYSKFERLGQLIDIDMAISCMGEAVSLAPDGYPGKPRMLSNLGSSHQRRFERLGQLEDINVAVKYQSQAVALTPDDNPGKPGRLGNLGASFYRKFERSRQLADLDMAISCNSEAVLLTPDGNLEKPGRLSNLAISYKCRFERLGQLEDLNVAVKYQSEAVALTPDENSDKPTRISNLGDTYAARLQHFGQLEDANISIEYQAQAVALTPEGHPDKPNHLNNLGNAYSQRFQLLEAPADLGHAMAAFKQAAQSSTGHPLTRLNASRRWASLSYVLGISSLDAYHRAMSLIPQVVWLGNATEQQLADSVSVQDLAVEAATVAIVLRRYDLAVEWLDEGRSIVWKQLLQLRAPLEELSTVDATLAEKLKRVSYDLYSTASRTPIGGDVATTEVPLETTAQNHRRLAEEWERLVDQARLLPGMSDFSRPKAALNLKRVARTGPVVIISVYQAYCCALALLPNSGGIDFIDLPNFTYKNAALASTRLIHSLRSQGVHERGFTSKQPKPQEQLETMLCMLWTDVVKPVLDHLGFKIPSGRELPHITWCTTGPLSFLPLHAAGDYSKPNCSLYDYAVSSYTPTLGALLTPPSPPSEFSGLLAVGQTSTPGHSPLPGTVFELNSIRGKAKDVRFTRIEGEQATTSAVLTGMEQHSWAHFACHASQNPAEPTKSAFHLHDGALDLATITQRPLERAQLAFLSACQTATGDKDMPEEAVHLAAGMLMAGYPTVIATMWSIVDKDAPIIAEKFYECVMESGVPDARKAARALHTAVGHLRAQVGVKEFARWAPYIHIGQ